MARNWGNSDHGPGGDPAWLGGRDREPSAEGSNGWSSDFSSQPPPRDPSAGQHERAPQPAQAPGMAPRFGERAEGAGGQQESQWSSDFTGQQQGENQNGRRRSRSLGAQLVGLFTSMIGLIIFAIIGYRTGMDMWWILLVVGIPLVSRGIRLIQRNLRS